MPIVQVISIMGKPNLWNKAQWEFIHGVPRWKLNLGKSVNPTLLHWKNSEWSVWHKILQDWNIYTHVPIKVHPSASSHVSPQLYLYLFLFLSNDNLWTVPHYFPFRGAFVYACLCVCVAFDSEQQGSRFSPAEERGKHVTRFIEVVLKCESSNIMAESKARDNSIKVWSPGINGEVKGWRCNRLMIPVPPFNVSCFPQPP